MPSTRLRSYLFVIVQFACLIYIALTGPLLATQPLALVASADGNGNIELRWKRNGNSAGTTFLIEYRLTATAAWSILGSTTKAKFFHTSAPGSYIEFRVTAQRADNESLPSTSVVLWGGSGSGESFELKAA